MQFLNPRCSYLAPQVTLKRRILGYNPRRHVTFCTLLFCSPVSSHVPPMFTFLKAICHELGIPIIVVKSAGDPPAKSPHIIPPFLINSCVPESPNLQAFSATSDPPSSMCSAPPSQQHPAAHPPASSTQLTHGVASQRGVHSRAQN